MAREQEVVRACEKGVANQMGKSVWVLFSLTKDSRRQTLSGCLLLAPIVQALVPYTAVADCNSSLVKCTRFSLACRSARGTLIKNAW